MVLFLHQDQLLIRKEVFNTVGGAIVNGFTLQAADDLVSWKETCKWLQLTQ